MKFTATNNFSQVTGAIDKFAKSIVPTVASVLVAQIKSLRAQGLNADGTASVPYTKQYAEYGRRKQGYPVSPVNHRKSGGYLDNIALWAYDPNTAQGYVSPDASHERIAEGLSRYRQDFGVNDATIPKIEDELAKEWSKYL